MEVHRWGGERGRGGGVARGHSCSQAFENNFLSSSVLMLYVGLSWSSFVLLSEVYEDRGPEARLEATKLVPRCRLAALINVAYSVKVNLGLELWAALPD